MTAEQHAATANLVQIAGVLLEHGGWVTTQGLAERTGIHRDTCRRILAEGARAGWFAHAEDDGGDRWSLGPELPRIGLAWLQKMTERACALKAEFDTITNSMAPRARGDA